MLGEMILGEGASYLRRLGALSALLCGLAALAGLPLLALDPGPESTGAVVACAVVACAGAVAARRP